ncbi:hypothetical protein VTJ04DRAFT_4035 [Mycothermus thermophilus]|uniref:uncharacterized protein n=1 Tax=Humicola insolens TaxID=85995 RepID=UPI003742BFFF
MTPPSRPSSPPVWDKTADDMADGDDRTVVASGPASLRCTPAPSCRQSIDSDLDRHVQDIEKALPIHTIPSLRLNTPKSPKKENITNLSSFPKSSHNDNHHPASPKQPSTPCPPLPLRPRLAHFTWAWYTLSMSTGGLALLIAAQPHTFPGLRQIGTVIYAFNCLLFLCITFALIARFTLHKGTFLASIRHPREGWFAPTFFLALATVVTGTYRFCVVDPAQQMGLVRVLRGVFWAYVAVTTALAVGQYTFVFSDRRRFGLETMMPTWILPVFPVMLSGTMATVVGTPVPSQTVDTQAVAIAAAGLTCQGLGAAVALMMYAHMVGRLMQAGLPHREHRTGLFMCVGPPSFTALAFVGLAKAVPATLDSDMDGFADAVVLKTMGMVGAGFLWALSFWWFGIAALAVAKNPPKDFHLGWWAAVFPNTGFTLATIALGEAFRNEAILWFSTVMSVALLTTYLFVLYHHVRAVIVQDIMYPGRDEDVEDH